MKKLLIPAFIIFRVTAALTQNQIATMRGDAPLDQNASAPVIAKSVNSDMRQARNCPEQPPVIPHKTDGYQIDSNHNKS